MKKTLFTLLISGFCALNAADDSDGRAGSKASVPAVEQQLDDAQAGSPNIVSAGGQSFLIVDGIAYPIAAVIPAVVAVIEADLPGAQQQVAGDKQSLSLDRVVEREAKRVEQQVKQGANNAVQNVAKALRKIRF